MIPRHLRLEPEPSALSDRAAAHRLDWMDRAACATGDGTVSAIHFPRDLGPKRPGPAHMETVAAQRRWAERRAKAMCNGGPTIVRLVGDVFVTVPNAGPPCPVREQCLRFAMEAERNNVRGKSWKELRFGIFGGLNPDERQALQDSGYFDEGAA